MKSIMECLISYLVTLVPCMSGTLKFKSTGGFERSRFNDLRIQEIQGVEIFL